MTALNPNAIQVGGTHYQNGYQHWDLVADFQLGYFPGQITKYITRHKRKNGLQDVQKALHFLDKWEEHMHCNRIDPLDRFQASQLLNTLLQRYNKDNALGRREQDVIFQCCVMRGRASVPYLRSSIQGILDEYAKPRINVTNIDSPGVELDSGEPGPGYVNQDQEAQIDSDLLIYGMSVKLDGVRVDPRRVSIFRKS